MDLFGLYAQLTGQVDECCCDVETVDTLNRQKVYPVITELVARTYFKFYQVRRIILEEACLSLRVCVCVCVSQVNLHRSCPFWPDDGRCVLKDCHVEKCTEVYTHCTRV